jgi:hypothetical protein
MTTLNGNVRASRLRRKGDVTRVREEHGRSEAKQFKWMYWLSGDVERMTRGVHHLQNAGCRWLTGEERFEIDGRVNTIHIRQPDIEDRKEAGEVWDQFRPGEADPDIEAA